MGVVVFDGAKELDRAGPGVVLGAWSRLWPAMGCHDALTQLPTSTQASMCATTAFHR